MGRQKEITRRSCEVLSPGLWFLCREHRVVGSKSCPLCYGASTPCLTDQRVTRRSSWFMGQRRFYLVISVTIHLVLRHMLQRTTKVLDRTLWTGWMKSET